MYTLSASQLLMSIPLFPQAIPMVTGSTTTTSQSGPLHCTGWLQQHMMPGTSSGPLSSCRQRTRPSLTRCVKTLRSQEFRKRDEFVESTAQRLKVSTV